MSRSPLQRETGRALLIGSVSALLLVGGFLLFFQYHQARQTTLAGYATAKAVAEQVAIQRRVYAQEILPRAQRAGMTVDTDFQHKPNSLPVPVALVNLSGEAMAQQLPGTRVLLYSKFPFTSRTKTVPVDGFENDALNTLEKDPSHPFYRLETQDGKPVMRYAIAEVMSAECVNCHNTHPDSPKRDWRVGDVRGAVEVSIPMNELASRMREEQVNFGLLLGAGIFLFSAVIGLFLRYDRARWKREQAALTDAITGLSTRHAALPLISNEVARAKRYDHPISFVLFDVDHFKQVNDAHGHAAGDKVLADVGRTLQDQLRQSDIAARWGGEEFLAVLPAIGLEGARVVAERIRQKLEMSASAGVSVTISAGVAELTKEETGTDAIARADAALYQAKGSGRNSVRG